MLTSATMMLNGKPTFTKSPKLYWPGPTTRVFTGEEIGAQRHPFDRTLRIQRDRQLERGAGVIMPAFGRVDLVPMRALAAREQKIGRGRRRACAIHLTGVAERLAKMSAFGMRLEVEQADQLGGGGHRCSFIEHAQIVFRE